jgi:hypothetical protein
MPAIAGMSVAGKTNVRMKMRDRAKRIFMSLPHFSLV